MKDELSCEGKRLEHMSNALTCSAESALRLYYLVVSTGYNTLIYSPTETETVFGEHMKIYVCGQSSSIQEQSNKTGRSKSLI